MSKSLPRAELEKRRAALAAQCEDYAPRRKSHQCQHYAGNGACSRPDYFMCVVWMKKNPSVTVEPPTVPEQKEAYEAAALSANHAGELSANSTTEEKRIRPRRSLKDQFLDEPVSPPTPPPREAKTAEIYDLTRYGVKTVEPQRTLLEHPELLTEEAITALEKTGYEITVTTPAGAEVTIVPEYTSQDRCELSYKDARTLVMVLQVFPGSTLAQITKPPKEQAS